MTNLNFGLNAPMWIQQYWGLFVLVMVWSIIWKGLALWHSGRQGKPWWFVIFLFLNTVGILEIIYLFFILKLKASQLFSK